MAYKNATEFVKHARRCPTHGSTHLQALIIPDPGDYFAAFYECWQCAPARVDELNARNCATCGEDHHETSQCPMAIGEREDALGLEE